MNFCPLHVLKFLSKLVHNWIRYGAPIPRFYFALVFFNEDWGNLYTQIKEHLKIAFIEVGDHILNMHGTLLFSHFLFKFV